MGIQGNLLKIDDRGWQFILLEEEPTAELFAHNKGFWTTRGQETLSDDIKHQIIEQQASAYTRSDRKPFRDLINSFLKDRPRPIKLVEFGCSNGTLLDHLAACHPDVSNELRFIGFETLPLLVEDGRRRYPDQTFVLGTEQHFIEAPASLFPDAPYDAFVAAVSLCMVGPDAVRKILKRAHAVAETILLWEMLAFLDGADLGRRSIAVRIPGLVNTIFAHPWRHFLEEAGFSLENVLIAKQNLQALPGFGALIARRSEQ